MGATSVTGVGPGAADGNKGPGNGREQFVPLLTPHVVAAGTATLAAGTITVTFPTPLPNSETAYSVIVTPRVTNATSLFVAKTDDGDGLFASFDIDDTGAGYANEVDWIVVQHGNA
jgi:hypothetical protein